MRWLWQEKRTPVVAVQPWLSGVPQAPPRNYRTYQIEAFSKSPLVYGCVAFKAQSASDIRLQAQQLISGEWCDADDTTRRTPAADELQALLDNPNPRQDMTEWLMDTIACQQVAGNAYTQIELSQTGRPIALWHLPRPEAMQIVPDDRKGIGGYVYNPGREPIPLPPEEVIHFRELADPLNPLLGMSPLVPIAREIDADNAATDFLKQFFDKGGMPAIAMITKTQLTDPQVKRLRALWETQFSIGQGGNQAGGVAFLNGAEMQLQKVGSTTGSREMGLTEIRQVIEARVCAAYRVHPQVAFTMLGFQHPTYAQAHMAEEVSWQMGLIPMYTRYVGRLNVAFRLYYPDCRIVADYSKVPALQEDEGARWQRHQTAFDSGAETREEFRGSVGLPAEPKGLFYVPTNRTEQKPGEPLAPKLLAAEQIPATVADLEAQLGRAEGATPVADPDAHQLPPHAEAPEKQPTGQVTARPKRAPRYRRKAAADLDDPQVHRLIAAGGAALAALVADLRADRITKAAFGARAAAALTSRAQLAGGDAAADALDGLDDDLDQYADDVTAGDATDKQLAAWGLALAGVIWTAYQRGRVADGDAERWDWMLGASEHHCGGCLDNADGSPYTVAMLPGYPGDGGTPCGGFCMCSLEPHDEGDE